MTRVALTIVAAFPSEVLPRLARAPGVHVVLTGPGWTWRAPPDLGPGRDALLVMGACGALSRHAVPGSVVLPSSIAGRRSFLPTLALRAALRRAAAARGIAVAEGILVEAASVVATEADRRALPPEAEFVDVESARIAEAAEAAGRSWAVLRFVTDTPERPLGWLPEVIGGWPDAEPSALAMTRGLLRHPARIPDAIRVGLALHRGRRGAGDIVLGALAAGAPDASA